GVLGAIVGNQIGKGSGRAVATVAGAVGGGWAGNAIEKNMKKTTVYQVHVRMEDGSLKTIEQASPAAVGARVTVDGGTLHPANDGAAAPAPERPTAVPVYTRG
nr:glycine zipper 2TM domain-containing protein [Rhodoferax sp.]